MKLPKQSMPIFRTTTGKIKDNEQPIATIDFVHASRNYKSDLANRLINGANYNSPMRFLAPVDFYGCHLLSGNSMAMCLAAMGRL